MTDPAPEAAPRRAAPSWRTALSQQLSPATVLTVLAAIAIGIIALVGGWDSVRTQKAAALSEATAGQQLTVHPFLITVTDAYWTSELPLTLLASPGQRWLVAQAEVGNTTSSPIPRDRLRQAMLLAIGDQQVPPTLVARLGDTLRVSTIQPGMTKTWLFAWEIPTDQPLPKQLRLVTQQQTYRASSLGDGYGWFDPTPTHAVTVPLTEQERTW